MVTCPICNKEMNYINSTHLKTHNLTPGEFKNKYPKVKTTSEETSKSLSRKNNDNFLSSHEMRGQKMIILNIEKYNKLQKKCKKCNNLIPYEKRKNSHCNSSCGASLGNIGRKVVYTEQALANLRASIKKTKPGLKKKPPPILCCKICNKKFERLGYRINKTCSPPCLAIYRSKFNAAQGVNYGKHGYYKGIYCASSWELAFLIHSIDQGHTIERCTLTFEYKLKEKIHTYFPDFIIDNVIYEVKGRELEDVALKTKAVIKAGYNIKVVRRREIEPIIKSLKEKYAVKNVIDLYDSVEIKI